jgi:hypothetical protein
MTTDFFDLQRFLDAQAPVYPVVLGELQAGRKQSHWMWFIFPLRRHPTLLFDVVGTDGGAQELSLSKPIPANTTALVQGPGHQHISLAMRLNKHTRDAL